eukprot:3487330-Amphidinium_carterae.1
METPLDKSTPVPTNLVTQAVQSNSREGSKWEESIKKELASLTEETPCLTPVTQDELNVLVRKAQKEGLPIQRIPSKMVFVIKTTGKRKSRLVACGNYCEQIGQTSTTDLDGLLL